MQEIFDISISTYLISTIKNLFVGAIGILFLAILIELAVLLFLKIKKYNK